LAGLLGPVVLGTLPTDLGKRSPKDHATREDAVKLNRRPDLAPAVAAMPPKPPAAVAASPAVRLKIPDAEGRIIIDELSKPDVRGCERFVLALTGISRQASQTGLLVRKAFPVPEDAYFLHPRGSAWAPSFTSKILFEGERVGAGLLLFHRHGFSRRPRLSDVDEESLAALLPACVSTTPSQPHGSAVLGVGGSVGGQVWLPGTRLDAVT
jgi:hypothetical protein